MPIAVVALPEDYGYVLLTAVLSAFVNQWHGSHVGKYRKLAAVKYPTAYVTETESAKSLEKYQFNCAQRAHANFLENWPNFFVTMMVAGLASPKVAAGLGAVWLGGRIVYAVGYTRPERDGGKGRYRGMFQYVGLLGNMGYSLYAVYKMLV